MGWYVKRIEGKIVTACPGFVEGMAEEEITDNSVELQEFLNPSSATPPLSELKRQLKAAVDTAAEVARRKYITPGSGQAMTYMQKADEASRYLQASDPIPANYPLLSAEVGITAETLREVAEVVHEAYSQWQLVGAGIEAVRLSTKTAIDLADTPLDAHAAADAVTWP